MTCLLNGAKTSDVYVMPINATKPALEALLARHKVGTWVVLDPSMSKILGAGRTPESAMKQAQVPPVAKNPSAKRPVMFQVPDRSMVCFF